MCFWVRQANGGTLCTAARKAGGDCIHTVIAALGVIGSEISEEVLDDEDGEGSGDEGIGSASLEYKRNSPTFVARVETLLRVFGAIKYPVHVQSALKADAKDGKCSRIRSLEAVCPNCCRMHVNLRNETVTAVVPVSVILDAASF